MIIDKMFVCCIMNLAVLLITLKTKRFSLYASTVDGKKHPIMFWILYILCLGCFIWLSIRYL